LARCFESYPGRCPGRCPGLFSVQTCPN
jgi:hypothetical protein